MTLLGVSRLGDSRTDITGLWARFAELEPRIAQRVPAARYIIITWGGETEVTYKHFLYVGMEVSRIQAPPLDTIVKILPAAQYAVFSTWVYELDKVWRYALEEWLPASPYQEPGFIIQRYDRLRYLQARPPKREIDIYIPLRKK
jgi:predicted transcriptional regulator YdeE